MRSIRGGSGLGDSLYLQSVVRHLIGKGESLRVHSDWPAVFGQLGDMVTVEPFSRKNINILAHYSSRKALTNSTQWEDVCASAGISEPVELRLDWAPETTLDIRPYVCVQLPRAPMGRSDGFGADLLPDCRLIQRAIDALRDRFAIVQIGAGEPLFRFKHLDLDLTGKTSVAGMLDVAAGASGFLGYVSYIVPLAESLDKPAMLVWSHKGLSRGHPYIRQITPAKILSKPSCKFVIDNWPLADIDKVFDGFLH